MKKKLFMATFMLCMLCGCTAPAGSPLDRLQKKTTENVQTDDIQADETADEEKEDISDPVNPGVSENVVLQQENGAEYQSDEPVQGLNIKNENITNTFFTAPDGTTVKITYDEQVKYETADFSQLDIGIPYEKLRYKDYSVMVGYVDYSEADKLDNLGLIFNDNEDFSGTEVIELEGVKSAQLYFDVDTVKCYSPIACSYKKTTDGYIYAVFIGRDILNPNLTEKELVYLLTSGDENLKTDALEFYNNYIHFRS